MAGKRTAKRTSSKGKRKTTRKSAAAQRELFELKRGIWAGVNLFAAFVAFLSIFGVQGFLITAYDYVMGSLVGFGARIAVFVFVSAGLILIIKRKGKARLKVGSLMALPFVVGALHQVSANTCTWSAKGLLTGGRIHQTGGLIAGYIGDIFNWALSKVGAVILFYLLLFICLFMAFGEFIVRGIKLARTWSPAPEPQEEPEPEPVPARRPASSKPKVVDAYIEDKPLDEPKKEQKKDKPFYAGIFDIEKEKTEEPAPDKSKAFDPTAPMKPSFSSSDAALSIPREIHDEPEGLKPEAGTQADRNGGDIELIMSRPGSAAAPSQPGEPAKQESDEPPVEQQIENALKAEPEIKYMYPPISLLNEGKPKSRRSGERIREYGERLIDTLQSFGVQATLVDVTAGPTVTRFELQLQRGVKVSRVEGLNTEIALSLGATGVRISTIPDKNAIGVEIPNAESEMVVIRDILGTQEFRDSKSKLSFAVGKDIGGCGLIGDISKMPHMLIAGTTGSGKSVCINSILISLLYKATPEEVRLIMVDPKMIELKVYNGIPHLLIPVVTDPKKAAGALNWAVAEMMKRYQLFSEVGTRDLKSYNEEMKKREGGQTLPQVVIVIDELSDLMTVAKKEVEEAIIRIAQMARAAGMHLIVATQRPSADVITGLIKANVPSRIAFAVSSQIESRIILDQMGAEQLVGKGDMLYSPLGGGRPRRVQGCFVSDGEVERVTDFIRNNSGKPEYSDEIMEHIEKHGNTADAAAGDGAAGAAGAGSEDDEMLDAAIDVVIESGQASTSMLQRRLKLGYARAARIMDLMEEKGVIGEFNGSKPRQILISRDAWMEMKLRKQENE